MQRLALERRQVWVYLVAIAAGLGLGSAAPGLAAPAEALLWPVLALLLYASFVQVPLLHVRAAFGDGRFVLAVLAGNFVAVPAALAVAQATLPPDPALRLGVLLVLLVPCTDWFISFTQLGRGDTARAIAVAPLLLGAQLLLLPVWLWLLLPAADLGAALRPQSLLPAAGLLIGLPLVGAALSERWIEAAPARARWRERMAWAPVPLLALVVFLIATAQVATVREAGPVLWSVLPIFVAYLLFAAVLARVLAALFGLEAPAGRTLAYSLGTRNSFVVLPVALALPGGWEGAVVVIVFQSLVELAGMVLYLAVLPRVFPPAGTPSPAPS